jgi:hypothetical protein
VMGKGAQSVQTRGASELLFVCCRGSTGTRDARVCHEQVPRSIFAAILYKYGTRVLEHVDVYVSLNIH